jgi:glycosyltransferase involved in cell wall biosynthesis
VTAPLASVVIPTRNRRATVLRTLAALDLQDVGPDAFEAVVVVNGSDDGTAEAIGQSRVRFSCRVIELEQGGASAARNAGAAASRGALTIFLDDDIAVVPGFLRAHLQGHSDSVGGRSVVIGYLATVLQPERDRFAIVLRGWWEAMFDRLREPGHRAVYTDLLSGNCSMPRALFDEVGGYDENLRCHEDYELGYRLIAAGARFFFAESAAGLHADRTRLARACLRKREEGEADVYLARRYPELRTSLPIARARTRKQRLLRWLAFRWPWLGEGGARVLGATLPVLDRTGATMTWLRALYAIFGYWYARGLADALPDLGALDELLEAAWTEPRLTDPGPVIDLSPGVGVAAAALDEQRPSAARLAVGKRLIAQIPWVPGSEPLAGRHLAPLLASRYYRHYVEAVLAGQLCRLDDLGRPPLPGQPPTAPAGDSADLAALRG